MSGKETSEEKTLPPSAKKLREARKKGQIARSKEMVTAVVTVTAFGYLAFSAAGWFDHLREGLLTLPTLLNAPFVDSAYPLIARLSREAAWVVAPFAGLLVAMAILTNIAVNGGGLMSVDPILPKMEHIDPVQGFKKLVALKNFIELLKAVIKTAALGTVTIVLIRSALQVLVEQPACGLSCAGPILKGLVRPLLLSAAGFFLVVGFLDIGLQKWLFARDMRMTKSEMKRERKESEGDPLIKNQHKRERRSAQATKTGLRNATFVIRSVDAALAMRFAQPDATVPILVARGVNENASLLLKEARAMELPVVFNAEAMAVVLPRLQVGKMITQEMFQPVIACMREAGLI